MNYIHELGPLFHDVQMGGIFPDGKTFPDCLPKANLADIAEQYKKQQNQPGFDLKAFVSAHFDLPPTIGSDFVSDPTRSPEKHIEALWDVLTRQPDAEPPKQSSLLPLPHPFVVPGGRFREVYYWDSFFTMIGLVESKRFDLVFHMMDNFAHLLDRYGFIPNGNRSYYLGRSQPPFFAQMMSLISPDKPDELFDLYGSHLKLEYVFWMNGHEVLDNAHTANRRVVRMPNGAHLNRYWDSFDTPRPEAYREDMDLSYRSKQPAAQLFKNLRAAAESGWDFSSRWLNDENDFASIRTTDIIPVDLNCLMLFMEQIMWEQCLEEGNEERAEKLKLLMFARKHSISTYCWDEEEGFFFDYNFVKGKRTNKLTLAGVFPLFVNIATDEQARRVAERLEKDFLKPGGLTTTLENTGQQWDAPNGWAPLQYIAYDGLRNYRHDRLAKEIRTRWLTTVRTVYEKTGKMTEKYNVFNETKDAEGGEYPNQDGFGWTNGVYLMMNDRMMNGSGTFIIHH